MAKIIE